MTKKKLSLYYFDSCPFCVMVLNTLQIKNINVELKNTLEIPQHRSDLIKGGGKPQVPCLKIESNSQIKWLYESMDIINYLNTCN